MTIRTAIVAGTVATMTLGLSAAHADTWRYAFEEALEEVQHAHHDEGGVATAMTLQRSHDTV